MKEKIKFIWFIGDLFSYKNNIRFNCKTKRFYKDYKYVSYLKRVRAVVRSQIKYIPEKIEYPLKLYTLFIFKDNRRRDLLNMMHAIADALVYEGVIEDDDWKHFIPIFLEPKKSNFDGFILFFDKPNTKDIEKIFNFVKKIYHDNRNNT